MTGRVLINMGRIARGPWHCSGTRLWVFDQGVHFELAMFDGHAHGLVDFYRTAG